MLPELLLKTILALAVMIFGLYAMTFSGAFAKWATSLDGKFIRAHFNEKVYRIGFRVVGICFIVFGVLVILLLA